MSLYNKIYNQEQESMYESASRELLYIVKYILPGSLNQWKLLGVIYNTLKDTPKEI